MLRNFNRAIGIAGAMISACSATSAYAGSLSFYVNAGGANASIVGVVQYGANRVATVSQNAKTNVGAVIQAGTNLKANVSQTGSTNVISVHQSTASPSLLLGN